MINAETTAPISDWIGKSERVTDTVTPRLSFSLRAMLDHERFDDRSRALPQLGHWLLAPAIVPQAQLGADGHPAVGGFLPPVSLPRRMWASSKVEFLNPLPIGSEVVRVSTIKSVSEKSGSTGKLIFVEIDHKYLVAGVAAVVETQTIVYREAGAAGKPAATLEQPSEGWNLQTVALPTSTFLLRYSALTSNIHRIHYDRPYATGTEGYPNLIVHGPLLATLLVNLIAEKHGDDPLRAFNFRAVSPAYGDEPITLAAKHDGAEVQLRAVSSEGRVLMLAEGTLR